MTIFIMFSALELAQHTLEPYADRNSGNKRRELLMVGFRVQSTNYAPG